MEENININFKGNIIDVLTKMQTGFEQNSKSVEAFQNTATSTLQKIESKLKGISLAAFQQNLQSLNQGFQDLNAPGLSFNSNLKDLSALTGTTGTALDALGEKARASAKEFGNDAASSLNTYKTILSRLGPDIAKNQTALSGMEKNVQVLAKTMGNDAPGAVDALTTAMLQYNVDLTDAGKAQQEMAKMMDVMANAAQEGAAEVPQISAALKVSGVAAQQAKVSFIETNAAIQALAQGGKEGSEAGMALRNVLGKMAGEDVIPKEAAKKLKALGVDMNIVSDTTLPFTTRLRELKKAQGDATIMAQVFGVENAASAAILLNSVDAQDELAKKIGKTGGAQAQANVVMESTTEKLARMQAGIDDAKISFFEATGGMTAYLGPATQIMQTVTAFTPIFTGAKNAVMWLAKAENLQKIASVGSTVAKVAGAVATKVVTAAQWLWNAALNANPIGMVILAVTALSAAVYGVSKMISTSTAAEKLNAEVKQKVIDKTADQRTELDLLFITLKSAKVGSDEYNQTLADLEKMQPGIVEKYNLQAGAIQDINAAQTEMIKNINLIARAEALKEITKEKYKEALLKEAEGPSTFDQVAYFGMSEKMNKAKVQDLKNQSLLASEQLAQMQSSTAYQQATGNKKNNNTSLNETEEAYWNNLNGEMNDKPTLVKTTNTQSGSGSGSGSSSGSSGAKSISVRIENLLKGDIIIQSTNITEGLGKVKEEVTKALIASVRDFEVAI